MSESFPSELMPFVWLGVFLFGCSIGFLVGWLLAELRAPNRVTK